MALQKTAPSTEGATSKEVIEKEVATTEVVETAKEQTAEVVETEKEETAGAVETATEENPKVEESPVTGEFEVNGRKHKLSDRCPDKLQFNGVVYTREELLTNEDILESLVIGESPFVKKV